MCATLTGPHREPLRILGQVDTSYATLVEPRTCDVMCLRGDSSQLRLNTLATYYVQRPPLTFSERDLGVLVYRV